MIPAIKSEFLKLITVRSTYFILAFVLLIILFFAGYVEGYKAGPELINNPQMLGKEVINAISAVGIFCGLIAILLFSHEYRYNMIVYTMTSLRGRNQVLLAKIAVMTGFALAYGLAIAILSPLAAYMGAQLAGNDLVSQSIYYGDLLWRSWFYVWGMAMVGLLLVALTRNQVFSVVALFFIPVTVEGIATLLLKDNSIYLPFTALNSVINKTADISPPKAALVFMTYLLAWWAVAWILFLRRDANNSRG